ncbi:MAG: HAD family phosphatase [Clostridiales bacterium]|nr:HAD family phosphatase [Clostridiales bacterium]
MLKAVIFDMDGVLVDSEIVYLKQDLEFARTKNPEVTLEELYGMVGSSRKDAWTCMERAVHNGQTWQELRSEFYQGRNLCDVVDYRAAFRREVPAILSELQSMGLRLAVASSTMLNIVEQVLEMNGIRPFFELVVSGEQFKRSKPDPEIYLYTCRTLGLPADECLAIEDSTFGVTAASRAGMRIAALIDRRFDFDQSLADWRMEKLTEIPGIARQLTAAQDERSDKL